MEKVLQLQKLQFRIKLNLLLLWEVVRTAEKEERNKIAKILSIVSLSMIVMSYSLWHYISPQIWYISIAFGLLMFTYVLNLFYSGCFFFRIMFELALNNLVDELFFNPTKVEINEYITALIIVIIEMKKYKLKNKN